MRARACSRSRSCSALPAERQAADLYVNPHAGRLFGRRRRAASPATPPRRGARPTPAARPRAAGRRRAPRERDLPRAAAPAQLGHARRSRSSTRRTGPSTIAAPAGTVSVMLTGVHDIVLRGSERAAAAPQGDLDRRCEPHPDRSPTVANDRGVGVQIKRGDGGDGHALATHQQRPRRPARHERRARHDAAALARQRATAATGERYNGDGVELNSTGADW